jgi:hypothetical protein
MKVYLKEALAMIDGFVADRSITEGVGKALKEALEELATVTIPRVEKDTAERIACFFDQQGEKLTARVVREGLWKDKEDSDG